MNAPNAELMRRYGTESDFLEKEAGLSPFARRMLAALVMSRLSQAAGRELDDTQQQAMAMNDAFQRLQMQKLNPSIQGVRYSSPPLFAEGGAFGGVPYPVPLGMDAGMVRVASAVGAELARLDKEAGIMGSLAGAVAAGPKPLAKGLFGLGNALKAPVRGAAAALSSAPGQKALGAAKTFGRGALTAGALGLGAAGLGAYALAKPTLGYLSKEQQPANWGHSDYGAPQLAYGVNSYGQPQVGLPFIR